jgi:endoribonuclease Nob1
MIRVRLNAAVESGKIKIIMPAQEFLDEIRSSANKVGDFYLLSGTDKEVLALALEYKSRGYVPEIVSDDYSIQNVATNLGITFFTLTTFGIKRLLQWIRYCPACHKEYPSDCKTKECQICGTQLKRKPRKNRNAEDFKLKQNQK